MVTIHSTTRYGPPRVSRILYFLSGGLVFATFMRSKEIVHEWTDFLGLVVVAAAFSSLGWCGWFIARLSQKRQQRLRDERAAIFLSEVKAQRECSYTVYLRGFKSEGELPALTTRHSFELRGNPQPFETMELLVAEAMEPVAPLIALGRRSDQIGAGRVQTTEDEWELDFQLLAAHAEALFLLPGETPGVVQEIKWLRDHQFWDRLVLLMPHEDRGIGWAERWRALSATIAKEGLELPKYRSCGMVFRLGQNGRLDMFQTLRLGYQDLGLLVLEVAAGEGLKSGENLIDCPGCGYCERRIGPGKVTCKHCRRRVG